MSGSLVLPPAKSAAALSRHAVSGTPSSAITGIRINNTAIKQMSIAPAYLIFSFIPNPFLYCNLFEYIRKNIHIILFYLQKQLSSIRPAQAVDFWLKWFFSAVSCFLSGIHLL